MCFVLHLASWILYTHTTVIHLVKPYLWMHEIWLPGHGQRLKNLASSTLLRAEDLDFGLWHSHLVTRSTTEVATVSEEFKMKYLLPVKLGFFSCEISVSCSGVNDDSGLLGCNKVSVGKYCPMFWRIPDPSHSEELLAQWHHWRRLELSSPVPVILCLVYRCNDIYYSAFRKSLCTYKNTFLNWKNHSG
jgi:hypothetical protein